MDAGKSAIDRFRALCEERLGFLEGHGFRRAPQLDESSATVASVAYLGRNVGFVFSFDVRDQCVDARIFRVEDGRAAVSHAAARGTDLATHLVRRCGYRGPLPRVGTAAGGQSSDSEITAALDEWAGILRTDGSGLLHDDAGELTA